MSKFFAQVWRVKCLEDMSEKTAGLQIPVSDVKLDIWNSMKLAASNDVSGAYLGLTKIALGIYNAGVSANCAKIASDSESRDFAAISFATAYAVDQSIDKLANDREITASDALEFHRINADSALDDIFGMLKESDWYKHPAVIGAGAGAVLGGGVGAWGDDENRLRGGLFGAASGAAIGGIGGAIAHDWRTASGLEEAAAASVAQKATQETAAAELRVNNILGQWQQAAHFPEVAGVLNANEQALRARFATGAEDLPAEVVDALGKLHPNAYQNLIEARQAKFPPVGPQKGPKGGFGGGKGQRGGP